MSAHHKMGMSRWTPWSVCSHYDSVERSTAASLGSGQHDKLHRKLTGDETLELDTTSMLDRAVEWAANIINETAGDNTVYSEEMVEIRESVSPQLKGIYGTVDAFFVETDEHGEKVIHVFDFKAMGKGMGCDLFPQLKGYALGVASMLGVSDGRTKCVLHILLGGVFSHEILETDLFDCRTQGETVVNARKHNEAAPYCPSEWCKYCKHSTYCVATDEQIDVVRQGVLNSLSVPMRLVLIDQLESILKKAKEEAKAEIALNDSKMIEDNGVAYAIKITNGPAQLKPDSMLDIYGMCVTSGVTLDEFLGVSKLSKTDLMKLIASKAGIPIRSKKEDVVTAETMVAPYFESKQVEKLERVK